MNLKMEQIGLSVAAKSGQPLFNFTTSKAHDFMGIRPTEILGKILF